MRTKAGKIPPFEIYRDRGRIAAELRMVLGNLVNGRAPWPLYLHGQPGRGKTCAGLALCDWADWAMYCTVRKLCNQIMRKDEAVCPWDWTGCPPLAVLDEIGARERTGDLDYEAVKLFADWREQKGGRVAVYISNLLPDRIADVYDDRIGSRILCGTWFELTGPDRRRA